jgi:hypothetical protein
MSRRNPVGGTPARVVAAFTGVLVLAGLLTAVTTTSSTAATDPCGVNGNKISCENSKPGSPRSEWDIQGAGDEDIQGFASDISVNVGSRIDFKIDTTARAYTATIYRTGYYDKAGARRITTITPSATLPQKQPECITDATTQLYDCGNWAVSASWDVPADAVSGVYLVKLRRPDTGGVSHITFIVRDDASTSAIVAQTSDPTWQAYNTYGGSSFYRGGSNGRAYSLSYNRPFATRAGTEARDFYFGAEYPMVRFMEKNGYDVSYIAGVDTDRRGSLLTRHKVFVSMGHDEYWSKEQRANVEAARDAGVNLMFLSGNEAYWRTRYQASSDASRTPYRTLTSYKETWAGEKIDPSDEWTGTWRDPRFAPKDKGAGLPENALTGTIYMSNFTDLPVTVSAAEGRLRLWRGSGLQSMAAGTTTALAPHTVGYESDEDLDNGSRPEGLIRLSTTTGSTPERLLDFGKDVAPGTTTHHLTMYRAPSKALVFSAGSVQWTWGLDATHDGNGAPADRRMQQAQVNLFADMSAQPTTLDPDLIRATASSDTTKPTATISSPAAGATIANGTTVTATGTASDVGGAVAGVEVSTDDGATWHPATGTTSWSYSYTQHGTGATPLKARAIDDSANIGTATTRSLAITCPCSVFGAEVPAVTAANDSGSLELGLRFTARADGFVSGARFYKDASNTGTHAASLWSTSGQRLATATFADESASGWQKVSFSSAVPVTQGTSYVVSYTAPRGRYAVLSDAFSSQGLDAAPLSVAGGFGATPAGVYAEAGRFPETTHRNSSYYVDPVFTTTDTSPLTVTSRWPLADATSVPAGTTITATFSKPVTAGSATLGLKDANGVAIGGSTSYDAATRTVTFTPSSRLNGFVKHTATVGGVDAQGAGVTTGRTWSFTTARPAPAPGVCPCGLFDDSTVPTVLQSADAGAVTLGVRFASDSAGTITGVKFYKGPGNTGSHTGALWSSDGRRLAEGTFTDESSSGWQTLMFAEPVAITKDTEYVASYRAPAGGYSATPDGLGAARPGSPLRTAANGGAYTYGTGFPSARSSTSYLVDVVFERPAPQISISAQDPAPGAIGVPRSTAVAVWVEPFAGTTSLSTDATRLTFTPASPLPQDALLTATLSGVTSTGGAALATRTWTFRTVSSDPDAVPQSLFADDVPAQTAAESSAVELGTVFSPTRNGRITAIRFHKGTGNAGTHVGTIWSSTGQQLATATFTNETPTGWQSAILSQPLAVTAGTSYVVSYLAPQGHYSNTPGYFASAVTRGDLTAPAGKNGRFLYGAPGGFPVYDYGSTNYFVDVAFVADAPVVTLEDTSPAGGATDVLRTSDVSATLSSRISAGYSLSVEHSGGTVTGTTTLSSDGTTVTFQPADPMPADTTMTARLSGVVSTAGATLAPRAWTFRTEAATTPAVSLFTGRTPATAAVNDGAAVEVGTAFTPSTAGTVTGIRFYKGSGNNGPHVGSLWSATGTRLGQVPFTGESAGGWQTATLASPVAVAAGTTYVVSYLAPAGHYSATGGFFATPYTAGPLTARSGANGLFTYGAGGGFPDQSYGATNYFVDVLFRGAS